MSIYEYSGVSVCKGLLPKLTVFPADTIPSRHPNLRITVVPAIYMHPQCILLRLIVVDNLRPLNDAVGSEVAARCSTEKGSDVLPPHEVGARVAVYILEWGSICFVLADEVVGSVFGDYAGAVGLDVATV